MKELKEIKGLMECKIKFKQYPLFLKNDLLKELLLLNSENFDDGKLFDRTILTKEDLDNHINKGYNPDLFFECWSDKEKSSFSLIPNPSEINKKHCLITFYVDVSINNNGTMLHSLREITIQDKKTLMKILSIGYQRNDMQSLFETKNYSYLTTDSVLLAKIESNKDKDAFSFINNLLNSCNQIFPEKTYCFDFSFPKHMFNID